MYFVYELVDPQTDITGYVGITSNPNQRYYAHIEGRADKGKKYEWIKSIQEKQLQPKMKILEIVDDSKQAREQEKYWIQHYLSKGIDLTNIYTYKPTKIQIETNESKNKSIAQTYKATTNDVDELELAAFQANQAGRIKPLCNHLED